MQRICYKIDSHNSRQEYKSIFKQTQQSLTKILRTNFSSWFERLANEKASDYCDCPQNQERCFPGIDAHERLSPLYYIDRSYQCSRQTYSKSSHDDPHTQTELIRRGNLSN